jgi:hypothetical protein
VDLQHEQSAPLTVGLSAIQSAPLQIPLAPIHEIVPIFDGWDRIALTTVNEIVPIFDGWDRIAQTAIHKIVPICDANDHAARAPIYKVVPIISDCIACRDWSYANAGLDEEPAHRHERESEHGQRKAAKRIQVLHFILLGDESDFSQPLTPFNHENQAEIRWKPRGCDGTSTGFLRESVRGNKNTADVCGVLLFYDFFTFE